MFFTLRKLMGHAGLLNLLNMASTPRSHKSRPEPISFYKQAIYYFQRTFLQGTEL